MFQLSIAALQTTPTLSGLKQPFHCISQFRGSDIWAKLGGIILLLHVHQLKSVSIHLVAGLGRRVQDGFTLIPGALAGMAGRLGSAGTIDRITSM